MSEYVCVIGGANIDISGTSISSLNPNDSNPGNITTSLGGVARNIAENLSRLDVKVEFITVMGDDSYSEEIKKDCREHNISIGNSEIIQNENTSKYLCINDENGEMQLAISDMEIYKYITPEFLKEKLEIINKSRACVVDTNIPQVSLEFLMDNCVAPIFLDTVSIKKTEKIKDSLHNIHTLKPNILEAEILSNTKIKSEEDLEVATKIILNKGVKQIFVSLGSKGVYFTNGVLQGRLPSITQDIVNTTGAGDSYISAVVWAYLKGFDLEKSAKAGLAASNICVKSTRTVSEDISVGNIEKLIIDKWR